MTLKFAAFVAFFYALLNCAEKAVSGTPAFGIDMPWLWWIAAAGWAGWMVMLFFARVDLP